MTNKEGDTERSALVEALRMIDEVVWGNLIQSEESRAHREKWVKWALEGRTTARLRTGIKHALEPLVAHPPAVRAALTARVRGATGIDLNTFRQAHVRRITAIMERGLVRSITDYESLREHIDELEGTPGRAEEVGNAYRLIGEFEATYSKRGKRA